MAPEVEQAFKRVLPERAGSVVVSDLDRAFQLAHTYPEKSFLTLDGEALTPRGLLSATAVQSKKLGLLALKRQKKELEKKRAQVQARLSRPKRKKNGRRTSSRRSAAFALHSRSRSTRLKKRTSRSRISNNRPRTSRNAWTRRSASSRRKPGRSKMKTPARSRRAAKLKKSLRKRRPSQAEVERLGLEAQAALQQLRNEFARAQEQFHLVSTDRKVMGERRVALQRTLERVEEQRLSLDARVKASLQSKAQDQQRVTSLQAELEKLRSRLQEAQQTEDRLKTDLQAVETEYDAWRQTQPEVERELTDLREAAGASQEQRTKCEVERARLETQLENTGQQCFEQLQQTIAEVLEAVSNEAGTLDEVTAAYNDLRDRIEEFGPINMTALEEYQENETRYNFLVHQKQDIELSIADTTKAIQEINRRSREKFREAFQAINENFKQIFTKLFGGGECGIQLLGEEDLLESGIDIYAQPPGKKVQNIMLLSGGEKAMTVSHFWSHSSITDPASTASSMKSTPRWMMPMSAGSPICVREMSEKTQFIVITHNKRTMETANYIYGVTMEEPGVSQVVSVKF